MDLSSDDETSDDNVGKCSDRHVDNAQIKDVNSLDVNNRNEPADEQLMLNYQAGDISAFEQLYLKHKGPLYRYFVRQIHDVQLAEDLYQETWGKVIKSVSQYQVKAKFTTWLYTIAHNLLIDHVRSVKPLDKSVSDEDLAMDDLAANSVSLPDQIQQHQQQNLMKYCIAQLPSLQKEAFLLNIELGLTAACISDIAGVTLEATKSRIRYAYKSIKDCVALKWGEI